MQTETNSGLLHTQNELTASIKAADSEINSFVEVFDIPDDKGKGSDPLSGMTFAVKEIIDQKGCKSPWGVDFLYKRSGVETATSVVTLERAGARRIGTTRSTLMAIVGDSGTKNPRDMTRSPGGSSAGSAAAVAARFVDFALGTQTVGSIIRPSSYCGVSGFKPTFGKISTQGVMPLARELDHVGVIGRNVATIKSVMKEFAVPEPETMAIKQIFMPDIWFDCEIHPAVDVAIEVAKNALEKLGLDVRGLRIPDIVFQNEADVLNGLLYKGIHDNHGAFIRSNAHRLPAELVEFERLGGLISAEKHAALRTQHEDMKMIMLDLVPQGTGLLLPSVIDVPPLLGEGTGSRLPQRLWTLLGWPILGIPTGTYNGDLSHLSVSVQLVGRSGEDASLLDLGQKLESWHCQRKPA